MEKVFNDRPLRYLFGLSAYFFLVVLLLRALERPSAVCEYLFPVIVTLMVIRAVYIFFRRTNPDGRAESAQYAPIVRNAAIAIGYWLLIAIVADRLTDSVWIVYVIIAIIVVMGFAVLVFIRKKGGRIFG